MKRIFALFSIIALFVIIGTAGARTRNLTLDISAPVSSFGIIDTISATDDTLFVTVNGNTDVFSPYIFMQQTANSPDTFYIRYRPLPDKTLIVLDSAGTRVSVKTDTMAAGSNFLPISWYQMAGGDTNRADTVCILKSSATRGYFYSYVPTRKSGLVSDAFTPPSSSCWQFLYRTGSASDGGGSATTRNLKVIIMFNAQRKR